ncbi:hypothetical protein V512_000330 [Mesotoga sp. Brook.08.105.5.1]|jgi:phytoene dehydrogenase-like protein|uniref:hypothetical protein n=1 Tax=Mesotoga sp. Brook.08.105.5.1 TaxID=1421002 RepID=UPI000D50BAAB|nr:hypothetical protein [Mesotoga sp. Brook.08.105.5.1]PVD15394.1 hypothetical protein V512_000330 [Mesotoga sp. Brook.08.105.5.1]
MAGSNAKRYGRYSGGSGKFIESIVKRYASLGGEILYDSSAVKVIEREGKAVGVRLKSGQSLTPTMWFQMFTPMILLRN